MTDRTRGLKQAMPGVPVEWVDRLIYSDDKTDTIGTAELGKWVHTGLTSGTPPEGSFRSDNLDPTLVSELVLFTLPFAPDTINVSEMFNKFSGSESYFTIYEEDDPSKFYIFRLDSTNSGVLIPEGLEGPVPFVVKPITGTFTSFSSKLYLVKVTGTFATSHILHTFNFNISTFSGTDYRSYDVGDPYGPGWTTGFVAAPAASRGGIMLPIGGPDQSVSISSFIQSDTTGLIGFTLSCWKIERIGASSSETVTLAAEIITLTSVASLWYKGVDISPGFATGSDMFIVGIKNHFGTAGSLSGQLVLKVN